MRVRVFIAYYMPSLDPDGWCGRAEGHGSRCATALSSSEGGWMGKMGVKQTRSVAGPVLLRVCSGYASKALTDHDHDLGRLGFRSLRHFGKHSMLAKVGYIFECL